MSANDNVKTIQTVYEAFGRGDLPAILDALTDDVDWASTPRRPRCRGGACATARTR